MTKNILLAAASVAALGFASAAVAADVTVSVGGVPVTVADPYTLASEVDDTLSGELIATVDYDAVALPAADNLKLTFTLTGGATFDGAVTPADLTGFANVIISSGGADGSSTVTFLVSGPNGAGGGGAGDNSAATLTADIEVAAGASPSLTINTVTENNTPIEGGDATPAGGLDLIDYESVLDVTVTPDASDAVVTIASDFTAFDAATTGGSTTTAPIGTVDIAFDAGVFVDLDGNNATAADFDQAVITLTGDRTNLAIVDPDGAGANSTVSGANLTVQTVGTYTISLAYDGSGVINPSAYSVAVDITLDDPLEAADPYVVTPNALGDIVRQGTSVIAPWVASGTLGTGQSTRNTIRISNTGSEPTGEVYLEVVAAGTAGGVAPTYTSGVVGTGLTIPANGDIQLTSQAMQNFLGGDFRRADIRITVEGDDDDLIFRSRISYPDNRVTEITLEPEVTN